MKDYVAVRIGWRQLRPIWRLYFCQKGNGKPTTPLGDFTGFSGRSGLRMIRESFRGSVTVAHIVPDRSQYAFRVGR